MTVSLIDTHCHLDFAEFDHDRVSIVQQAKLAGVVSIVVPGVTASTWNRTRAVVSGHAELYAAYGLHPMFMEEHKDEHIKALREWIDQNKVIAVGECGLDYFIPNPDRSQQEKIFDAHAKLAYERELPLIIHARKSLDIVLKILKRYRGVKGVIHSFSGSEQQAFHCIKSGLFLGFGGPLTYPRATRLRRLIAKLPSDSIVLETDAPDQPDASHNGMRNEPGFLPQIAQEVAELRGCDIKDLATCTLQNTKELFGTGIIT